MPTVIRETFRHFKDIASFLTTWWSCGIPRVMRTITSGLSQRCSRKLCS
jgi:hypothetical protein